MDFFGQQANTRRRSRLLLLGFLLAYTATAAVIYFGIALVSRQLGLIPSVFEPSAPVAVVIGLFWVAILAGCLFRYLDVRAGGPALAQKFGAEHVSDSSPHVEDRELINVVAEMSAAANAPSPQVFVLRRENSVNAFVLGGAQDKRALVLTQGALDTFERDELQAVIAHEFGHIAQGDLEVNMRLLTALGGLMALDEMGRMLIGSVTLKALIRRDKSQSLHPGVFAGLAMRLCGSVGVFFGSLLRSAFSRQREFLADASAVQFTRAPFALASALTAISEADDEVPLHLPQAPELVHLCFSGGPGQGLARKTRLWKRPLFARWFATHPPVPARIDAIDPHFTVKRRKLDKAARAAARKGDVGGMAAVAAPVSAAPALVMTMTAAAVHAEMSVAANGNVYSDVSCLAAIGPRNPTGLADRIMLLLPDERSCLAILFACFVPEEPIPRREFLDEVAYCFEQSFSDAVQELMLLLQEELESDRIGIVEHAASVLKSKLDIDKRQHALLTLEKLVRALGHEDLMSYASLQLIRRKLDVEFPVLTSAKLQSGACKRAQGGKIKGFAAMGEEFALLLSLIVEASGAAAQVLDEQYKRVLSCYTGAELPRRSSSEPQIIAQLEQAFQTLYVQPKAVRAAFVEHCAEIILHDGIVAERERSLLSLFAASLGCETVAPAHLISRVA